MTYSDDRIAGLDAIVLMEVVEHVDPERLPALETSVFAAARPAAVVVTTPNAEHNVRFERLAAGRFRHPDHRFEWTRADFRAWAERAAVAHGYTVTFHPVGPEDPEVGPPTQMAVLTRADVAAVLPDAKPIRFDSGYEVWVDKDKPPPRRRRDEAQAEVAERVILVDPSGVVTKARIRLPASSA